MAYSSREARVMSDRNLGILAGVTSISLTVFSRCSTLFSTVSAESTARALSLSTRTSSGYPLIVAIKKGQELLLNYGNAYPFERQVQI